MSSAEALLLAIRDQPDDDLARLAYADFLEEHGGREEAARAELIRTQVALANLPEDDEGRPRLLLREREVLATHEKHWRAAGAAWGARAAFVRGFPEQLTLNPGDFLRHGEKILALGPVTRLDLSDVSCHIEPLARSPLLRHVHGLTLRGVSLRELKYLLESPHTLNLAVLELDGLHLGADGARLLARWAAPPRLRELALTAHYIPDEGLTALLEAPWLGQLTRLDLRVNDLTAKAVEALVRSGSLRDLRSLDLGRNHIGTEGGMLLARWPGLAGLTELRLERNRIGQEAAAELACSPHAHNLQRLDLGCNYVGRDGARLLAGSPHLAKLHELLLRFDVEKIGDSGARALADSPHLKRLTHLDLAGTGVGGAGVAALAGSANLGRLRVLDLSHNALGDAGLAALARSAHLRGLTRLKLCETGCTGPGVSALAGSPNLAHVLELNLRGNRLDREVKRALAQSPHLPRLTKPEFDAEIWDEERYRRL